MSDPTTIRADQFLAHPPMKVWRVLTDSDLLARWLMPNDFAPVVGRAGLPVSDHDHARSWM